MTLGQRILKLRKEKKLTQEQLAMQLYVTRQTISNWEQDKSQPDLEKLQRLAEIFTVDMNTLVGNLEGTKPKIKQTRDNTRDSIIIMILTFIFSILVTILAITTSIFESEISVRGLFIFIYLLIMYQFYWMKKKPERIDLITNISYSRTFNPEKHGASYLNYMYKISLSLFIFAIILTVIFQLTSLNIIADVILMMNQLLLLIAFSYSKSRQLGK